MSVSVGSEAYIKYISSTMEWILEMIAEKTWSPFKFNLTFQTVIEIDWFRRWFLSYQFSYSGKKQKQKMYCNNNIKTIFIHYRQNPFQWATHYQFDTSQRVTSNFDFWSSKYTLLSRSALFRCVSLCRENKTRKGEK